MVRSEMYFCQFGTSLSCFISLFSDSVAISDLVHFIPTVAHAYTPVPARGPAPGPSCRRLSSLRLQSHLRSNILNLVPVPACVHQYLYTLSYTV